MSTLLRIDFRLARRFPEPSLKGMEVVSALLSRGRVLDCRPDILESAPESTDLAYTVFFEPVTQEAALTAQALLEADKELAQLSVAEAGPDDLHPGRAGRVLQVHEARLEELERQAAEVFAASARVGCLLGELDTLQEAPPPGMERRLKALLQAQQTVLPLVTALRDTSRRLLLVTAGDVLARLHRPVRDLARELDKEVRLTILGDDTEMPQSHLEELRDPLLHLVRNAVSHGLETGEERERAGKARAGHIKLSVYNAGDNLVVEVADDGRGLDVDRIGERALQLGLVDPRTLAGMPPERIFDFIYQPAFSTAETLTTVSGRGYGMDIVKSRLGRLHGTIEISTRPGLGTTFTLRIPVSASLVRALLVRVAGRCVALPASAIRAIAAAEDWTGEAVRGVRVISLSEALGWGETPSRRVVEVGVTERRLGLGVEVCLDRVELVVRPLGSFLGRIRGISGTAVLNDGSPVLVLDLPELVSRPGV
jgi:two-component system chemotaxis sensor kinase CheA